MQNLTISKLSFPEGINPNLRVSSPRTLFAIGTSYCVQSQDSDICAMFNSKGVRNEVWTQNITPKVVYNYLQRARNSHEYFTWAMRDKGYDINPSNIYSHAFPRNHLWLCCNSIENTHDLPGRIRCEEVKTSQNPYDVGYKLCQERQEYIGEQSLKFLQDAGHFPEGDNPVVADLLCETASFAKAVDNKASQERKEITTYALDADQRILEYARKFGYDSGVRVCADIQEPKPAGLQEADLAYISAPFFQNSDRFMESLKSYIKDDGKVVMGVPADTYGTYLANEPRPYQSEFLKAADKYFDVEVINAKQAQDNGTCKEECLIADTYAAMVVLRPKSETSEET